MRTGLLRVAALLAAAGLAVSGCTRSTEPTPDDNAGSEAGAPKPGTYRQPDGGAPVEGGTLTFAEYSETRSMDPAVVIPTAASGGNSMLAIYDHLIRYNPETDAYEPRLAQSVEPNQDASVWTIKLRPGVKFSDGTALDADAAVASMQRYVQNRGYDLGVIGPQLKGIDKVDEMTLTVSLNGPWPTFTDALGRGFGMIVAPAAYAGGDFRPIGAGAFTVEKYSPGEELVFAANPNYWDGAPHIEKLRFVWLGPDQTKYESFRSGSVQGGYVNDKLIVKEARDQNVPGIVQLSNDGQKLMLNQADGKPMTNAKARRAIQLALDPEMINQRVYKDAGLFHKTLFSPESRFYQGEIDGTGHNAEEARKLLEEAKAEGFDPNIEISAIDSPTGREQLLTIKSQLDAVGFTVTPDFGRTVADTINKVYVERSYTVAATGVQLEDHNPYWSMYSVYHSKSAANVLANQTPELDALIDELRATPVEDAQEVVDRIEKVYAEDVPAITIASLTPYTFWGENVYGLIGANAHMTDFSKAWIKP